jgi:hypothetical protein
MSSTYFAVVCMRCGRFVTESDPIRDIVADPTERLREMTESDQLLLTEFTIAHQSHGAEPMIVEVTPIRDDEFSLRKVTP